MSLLGKDEIKALQEKVHELSNFQMVLLDKIAHALAILEGAEDELPKHVRPRVREAIDELRRS